MGVGLLAIFFVVFMAISYVTTSTGPPTVSECRTDECRRIIEAGQRARALGLTDPDAMLRSYERNARKREVEQYDGLWK